MVGIDFAGKAQSNSGKDEHDGHDHRNNKTECVRTVPRDGDLAKGRVLIKLHDCVMLFLARRPALQRPWTMQCHFLGHLASRRYDPSRAWWKAMRIRRHAHRLALPASSATGEPGEDSPKAGCIRAQYISPESKPRVSQRSLATTLKGDKPVKSVPSSPAVFF